MDDLIKTRIEEHYAEYERLGIDTGEKYILELTTDLFFPYSNKLRPDVIFYSKSQTGNGMEEQMQACLNTLKYLNLPYCERTPYPNKRVHTICTKSGNKKCKYGLISIFNSYEEMLNNVVSIDVQWEIETKTILPIFVFVRYDISFEKDEKNDCKIYQINCYPCREENITDEDLSLMDKNCSNVIELPQIARTAFPITKGYYE